jgi:S1-C subfamily serine protease
MEISKLNAHVTLLLVFSMGWFLKPVTSGKSDTFSNYAQQAIESTVGIEAKWETCSDSIVFQKGAGVIVSSNGLVVTNYHNIGEAQFIVVSLYDSSRYMATVIAIEPRADLALLKITAKGLQSITLGDSERLFPGDPVFCIGNPGQLAYSLTGGIVSALNRSIGAIKEPSAIEQFIQTDAVINPGCSGGPLLNKKGQLIGINTAILTKSGHFEGYAFAVPVGLIKSLFKDFLYR